MKDSDITILVDDTACEGLDCEHGLCFWIEHAGAPVLFDTGQSGIIIKNADRLEIDPARAKAIVLSHGHYDHTGGLAAVLDVARQATVYLHPAAVEPKFSRRNNKTREIGVSDSTRGLINRMDDNGSQ